MALREVGKLVSLFRYPVKSMSAESLEVCDVSWAGLSGDRRWAFIRPGIERSGFPWLTIREKNDLWKYTPRFVDATQPNSSETRVRTPSGADFDVVDPALAAELGTGVRVIKQNLGVFDTFPLSLLSVQSVAAIGEAAGVAVTPRRFRPNLVVDAADTEPFPEDAWVGSTLRIGDLRMRIDKRDGRCVMVNVDPDTCETDARVLRAIAQQRDAHFGVYGSVVKPGTVRVGAEVFLED